MASIDPEMAEIESVSPAGAHGSEFVRPTGFSGIFWISWISWFIGFLMFYWFIGFPMVFSYRTIITSPGLLFELLKFEKAKWA